MSKWAYTKKKKQTEDKTLQYPTIQYWQYHVCQYANMYFHTCGQYENEQNLSLWANVSVQIKENKQGIFTEKRDACLPLQRTSDNFPFTTCIYSKCMITAVCNLLANQKIRPSNFPNPPKISQVNKQHHLKVTEISQPCFIILALFVLIAILP